MTSPAAYTLLRYTVALAFAYYVLLQARKPDKWFGRILARAMNKGHESMTEWGLGHVMIENEFKILDVGCGGGRTIEKLAAMAASGMVYGVDYAEGSIEVSSEHNAHLIKAARVVIQKASVSRLPFPDENFDLVTAIETQYYWPDLLGDMREILRVLKPAGRLVVIAETYKGGKYDWLKWPVMWLLRSSHLSVSDHTSLFASAGYVNVEIFEETNKGWICGMATKPTTAVSAGSFGPIRRPKEVQRFTQPFNAEVGAAALLKMALANPNCEGIMINSATSEHRILVPRKRIAELIARTAACG